MVFKLFAILQKYDFSSKSQRARHVDGHGGCCLRYCKSTIFQANHNWLRHGILPGLVVCDTAKVRFFKQITTHFVYFISIGVLFAILQKYDFSSKSQHPKTNTSAYMCCLRYCKSTIFQANHNPILLQSPMFRLFAILQKYDFSSKSQPLHVLLCAKLSCLRYCKSTIFQANHNSCWRVAHIRALFAILQKYDFSSKSQPIPVWRCKSYSCLRYCKSTIFQANHN